MFFRLVGDDVQLTEAGQIFALACAFMALAGVLCIANAWAALVWAIGFIVAPILILTVSLPPLKQNTSPAQAYYARYVDRQS